MMKKKFPLTVLADWKHIINEVNESVNTNSNIVKLSERESASLKVEDLESHFYFMVSNPQQANDGTSVFSTSYAPHNRQKINSIKYELKTDEVISHFNHWLGMIEEYENITLTEEEEITKQYINEFFDEFEIIDEDADLKAYDLNRQLLLLNYIQHIEDNIKNFAPENSKSELLEETINFKEELPKLTKRKTIRKLSELLAKLRKNGLEVLKEVWTEGKKEIIKRGLKQILDNVDKSVDIFIN